MRFRLISALMVGALSVHGQPGPAVGAKVPAFEVVDQNGQTRTLSNLSGKKGLMLVFYRSADW